MRDIALQHVQCRLPQITIDLGMCRLCELDGVRLWIDLEVCVVRVFYSNPSRGCQMNSGRRNQKYTGGGRRRYVRTYYTISALNYIGPIVFSSFVNLHVTVTDFQSQAYHLIQFQNISQHYVRSPISYAKYQKVVQYCQFCHTNIMDRDVVRTKYPGF